MWLFACKIIDQKFALLRIFVVKSPFLWVPVLAEVVTRLFPTSGPEHLHLHSSSCTPRYLEGSWFAMVAPADSFVAMDVDKDA